MNRTSYDRRVASSIQVDVRALQSRLFGANKVPEAEQWRMYYGNGVSPEQVECVIRAAQLGYMRDLTDLAYETVAIDPHLGAILGKRFRAIAALDYDVVAATGPGVEPEHASDVADMVRQALARIQNLPDAVQTLDWGHFDGRACVEKQWHYDPSDSIPWSISELSWIHPRRLTYGPERELRLNDEPWSGSAFEPRGYDLRSVPFKWTQFRPRLFNDYPEREGLAPRCLYFSLFKRFSWRERMVLLEVFGKPWRIVWVPDPIKAPVQDEQLDQAQESIDEMASNATGVLPPGVALNTDQPHPESGTLHKDIAQEADDQNSLLVLGNKRTSDAKPGALGSSADDVASEEQIGVIAADGRNLSAVFTTIAREIVLLNRGEAALKYAPRIRFVTETPPDRSEEIERTAKTIQIGIPIKLTEAYEKCGYEQPEPGDEVIQLTESGGTDPFGNPTSSKAPKIGIMGENGGIDTPPTAPPALPPAGPSEPVSEPGTEPIEATVDPDGDGDPGEPPTDESIASLATKMTEAGVTRCEHGSVNRCRLCGIERVRDFDTVDGETVWKVAWRPIAKTLSRGTAARPFDRHVCMARKHESVFGSPEVISDKGTDEAAAITAEWAASLGKSVVGLDKATDIRRSLSEAAKGLNIDAFARVADRQIMRGVMLGVLDSTWERENDEEVQLETFSRIRFDAKTDPKFVSQPYDEALRFFRAKQVLDPKQFARLQAAAKKRAFTIARLASRELLSTAKGELARMLEAGKGAMVPGTHSGPDLRDFRKFMAERIESAGWTPTNKSHVETIYRTNVMTAYGAGRKAEMTQPQVLKARPYWQIRGVRDDRQRPSHAAAIGIVLEATDPFWKRAYPPFGFNCRCRVISRSAKWVEINGVHVGPAPTGLPDDGWSSPGL